MPDPIDPNNVRPAKKVNDIGGPLRIDQYLTTFAVAYRQKQDQFIAPQASTPVSVLNESDKYAVFPRGYFLRDEAKVRPLGGRPPQVGYKVGQGQYLAEEWALEHTIDDRQRRNAAQPFDLDESGMMLLEGKQLIRQDRIWVDKFWGPGKWSIDLAVGNGTDPGTFVPFNDVASDPVETVDTYRNLFRAATGFVPNVLILGVNTRAVLKTNASMVERVKYTQTGIITNQLLASMFEVEKVLEAGAIYNAAEEGAEDDFQFIADMDGMLLLYIEPTARMDAPTAIARFAWTGLIPGAMNELGGVFNRGRDDRAYSDWIHSRNAFDIKQVAADLGMWFENASGRAA
jgi:hypothetical protein